MLSAMLRRSAPPAPVFIVLSRRACRLRAGGGGAPARTAHNHRRCGGRAAPAAALDRGYRRNDMVSSCPQARRRGDVREHVGDEELQRCWPKMGMGRAATAGLPSRSPRALAGRAPGHRRGCRVHVQRRTRFAVASPVRPSSRHRQRSRSGFAHAVFRFRERYPEMFYDAVSNAILPAHLLRPSTRSMADRAFGRSRWATAPIAWLAGRPRSRSTRRRFDLLPSAEAGIGDSSGHSRQSPGRRQQVIADRRTSRTACDPDNVKRARWANTSHLTYVGNVYTSSLQPALTPTRRSHIPFSRTGSASSLTDAVIAPVS